MKQQFLLSKKYDNKLLEIWTKYTLEAPQEEMDFFESGGDSLGAVSVMIEMQHVYQLDISLEQFMRNATLPFLQTMISEKAKNSA